MAYSYRPTYGDRQALQLNMESSSGGGVSNSAFMSTSASSLSSSLQQPISSGYMLSSTPTSSVSPLLRPSALSSFSGSIFDSDSGMSVSSEVPYDAHDQAEDDRWREYFSPQKEGEREREREAVQMREDVSLRMREDILPPKQSLFSSAIPTFTTDGLSENAQADEVPEDDSDWPNTWSSITQPTPIKETTTQQRENTEQAITHAFAASVDAFNNADNLAPPLRARDAGMPIASSFYRGSLVPSSAWSTDHSNTSTPTVFLNDDDDRLIPASDASVGSQSHVSSLQSSRAGSATHSRSSSHVFQSAQGGVAQMALPHLQPQQVQQLPSITQQPRIVFSTQQQQQQQQQSFDSQSRSNAALGYGAQGLQLRQPSPPPVGQRQPSPPPGLQGVNARMQPQAADMFFGSTMTVPAPVLRSNAATNPTFSHSTTGPVRGLPTAQVNYRHTTHHLQQQLQQQQQQQQFNRQQVHSQPLTPVGSFTSSGLVGAQQQQHSQSHPPSPKLHAMGPSGGSTASTSTAGSAVSSYAATPQLSPQSTPTMSPQTSPTRHGTNLNTLNISQAASQMYHQQQQHQQLQQQQPSLEMDSLQQQLLQLQRRANDNKPILDQLHSAMQNMQLQSTQQNQYQHQPHRQQQQQQQQQQPQQHQQTTYYVGSSCAANQQGYPSVQQHGTVQYGQQSHVAHSYQQQQQSSHMQQSRNEPQVQSHVRSNSFSHPHRRQPSQSPTRSPPALIDAQTLQMQILHNQQQLQQQLQQQQQQQYSSNAYAQQSAVAAHYPQRDPSPVGGHSHTHAHAQSRSRSSSGGSLHIKTSNLGMSGGVNSGNTGVTSGVQSGSSSTGTTPVPTTVILSGDSPASKGRFKSFYRDFWSFARTDSAAAFAFGKSALEKNENARIAWKVAMEMADLAKRQNSLPEARQWYTLSHTLEPHAAQAWLEHAKMEEECGELKRCGSLLQQAMCHCELQEPVMMKTLRHLERMGKADDARTTVLAKLKDLPVERVWRTVLEGALMEARLGNLSVARSVFKYLTVHCGWCGPVWHEAAAVEMRLGLTAKAKAIVERGLQQAQRYGPLWFTALKVWEREAVEASYALQMKQAALRVHAAAHIQTDSVEASDSNVASLSSSPASPLSPSSIEAELESIWNAPRLFATRALQALSAELQWKLLFDLGGMEERVALAAVGKAKSQGVVSFDRARAAYAAAIRACPPNLRWKVWLQGARCELLASVCESGRDSSAVASPLMPHASVKHLFTAPARVAVAHSLIMRSLSEVPLKVRSIAVLEYVRLLEFVGDSVGAAASLSQAQTEHRAEWKLFLESVLRCLRAGDTYAATNAAMQALEAHRGTGRLWALLIALAGKVDVLEYAKSKEGDSEKATASSSDEDAAANERRHHDSFRLQWLIFSRAIRSVPKSGEVWCEGARLVLNPYATKYFNMRLAKRFLNFAIHFTPQYGDSFIEYLRLKMILEGIVEFEPMADVQTDRRRQMSSLQVPQQPQSASSSSSAASSNHSSGRGTPVDRSPPSSSPLMQTVKPGSAPAGMLHASLLELPSSAALNPYLTSTGSDRTIAPSPSPSPPPPPQSKHFERVRLLCINAEPNYGSAWFMYKPHALLGPAEVLDVARGAIQKHLIRHQRQYHRAILKNWYRESAKSESESESETAETSEAKKAEMLQQALSALAAATDTHDAVTEATDMPDTMQSVQSVSALVEAERKAEAASAAEQRLSRQSSNASLSDVENDEYKRKVDDEDEGMTSRSHSSASDAEQLNIAIGGEDNALSNAPMSPASASVSPSSRSSQSTNSSSMSIEGEEVCNLVSGAASASAIDKNKAAAQAPAIDPVSGAILSPTTVRYARRIESGEVNLTRVPKAGAPAVESPATMSESSSSVTSDAEGDDDASPMHSASVSPLLPVECDDSDNSASAVAAMKDYADEFHSLQHLYPSIDAMDGIQRHRQLYGSDPIAP